MHHHRIAAFLTGCLLLGSLFMIFVATQNFQTVDRVLAAPPPEAAHAIQALGATDSRSLLRYLAGQQNQLFFESWEIALLVLGVVLTGFLLLGVRSRLLAGLSGALVIIAAFQHFRVTPEMIALGRVLDLGSPGQAAAYNQFWRLHGLYGVLEVVKLLLLAVVAGFLLLGKRSRAAKPVETSTADYAHR